MRFRPKNPNPALPNRHTIYLSQSGFGKSQMLAQNPAIPRSGARVLMWDGAGDHPGLHFESKVKFLQALKKGCGSGNGFRLAFAGSSVAEFEWWCEVCWSVLDGDQLTYLIAEELSQVSPSAAKASPNAAVLLNQARKYGGIFHGTSQKPQEVAKTYYDQCPHMFVGGQKTPKMNRRFADEIGATEAQISALQPLQFYYSCPGVAEPEYFNLKYRKVRGVKWVI